MSSQPIRTPQHTNPDQRRRQARAPYNFVPLPDRIVHAPDGLDALPTHDQYHKDRHTGTITCTLKTLSPLYTRTAVSPDFYRKWANNMEKLRSDANAKGDYAEYAKFFHIKNSEEPVIPGSSLRGMARSLMEIITHGYMPWVGNQPTFTFRAVAAPRSDPLQAPYQDTIGRFGRNVRAGYLERTHDGWAIQPALLPKLLNDSVDDSYLKVKETTIQDGAIQGFQRLNSPNYQPDWFPVTFNVETSRRMVRVAQIATIGTRKYQYAGVLVCSGNMLETGSSGQKSPRRNHALVLPPNRKVDSIPIDPQAVADYLAGMTPFQEDLANWGGKQNDGDATLGCLKEGAPIFYVAPIAGQPIAYFGHSPNFRIPARLDGEDRASNPLDFVPEALRSGEQPDLPAAIFGWVEETQKAKRKGKTLTLLTGQRAGRIFFSDAKYIRDEDGLWLSNNPTTLHTLGTPKPTTFQHYLVQDRRQRHDANNQATLAYYGTDPDETAIRGYKQYWHKGDRLDIDATPKEREHPKQLTQVRPVKPGVHFEFTIRFENLSDIELGALLWTLSLPGAEGKQYAHKLGMGKPLGMGSVYLTPTLQLDNRPARYQALLSNGQWHTPTAGGALVHTSMPLNATW
ncbi:MAG: TIGR03986 family CRISPR-associated RAMP protein [Caldilineaceae bacterium]